MLAIFISFTINESSFPRALSSSLTVVAGLNLISERTLTFSVKVNFGL
jgi:hypothetical protein